MPTIGKKLIESPDVNAILVDFGDLSYCNYKHLANIVAPDLGIYLGKCTSGWSLNLNKTEMIGYSLGTLLYSFRIEHFKTFFFNK